MATDAADEEFVTIVPVGEGRTAARDPSFVTVLTVGAVAGASEVEVRRPRGARLGLGLKFEGGSAAAEKVRRLLVQSCAEDSPAANACTPWGKLIPGDEILAIDGVSVSDLTRIDCVRRLKDSDETLKLLVRHFETDVEKEQNNMDTIDSVSVTKQLAEIVRPTALPPPVPPRKLGKKNSFKDKQTLQTVINTDEYKQSLNDKECAVNGQHNGFSNTIIKLSRKSSFDSHIHRQNKEGIAYLKKGSPEEVRRLVRRLSDGKAMPPEAEVFIDLLSTEWERCLALADAESDDTGSSISTVVDRLGSMTSSVENSIPSTPTMQAKTIDIQKVLNCIENIDSNILKDMTSSKFLEKQVDIKSETRIFEKNSLYGINNYETPSQMSLISEEVMTPKKLQQNDKNNNNTIVQNVTCELETKEKGELFNKTDSKSNAITEKPKPMPRNMKIERSHSEKKSRPISLPELPPPPVPEPLLTPTKKNCIESWLKRSEAEMNNNSLEKLEENTIAEVLPRLIDFVPKPQFKECVNDTTPMTRPTTAPPPPPVETREDGSGASLDTIGELDETSDITDIVKPIVIENETSSRKSSYERSFWEDRVNKSDAEDKSLSNDETPVPTCPRQPPDGVETPSDAIEKTPEASSRLPPRLSAGWPTTRTRFSYSSRTQDARSEASVKDKIAMFSNDHTVSSDRLDKFGTLPTRNSSTLRKNSTPYTANYSEVSSLDRRLTKSQDNLDEMPRSYKRHTDRPAALGENATSNSCNISSARSNRSLKETKPLFYGSTTTLPSSKDSSFIQPIYHARSVSDDNSNKSVHKSNLEYLIEQRKKSMSKLRGLIIPETQGPIVDLPEIKVQDSLSKTFFDKSNQNNLYCKDNKASNVKPINLSEPKWKADLLSNNIPKYSPAFKRKSLQVYTPSSLSKESTPERKFVEKVDTLYKVNDKPAIAKPLRSVLEPKNENERLSTSTLASKYSLTNSTKISNKEFLNNVRDYKNFDIKLCTATDVVDSDNDSAMSSTQSSYRSSASSPLHNLDSIESDSSRISPKTSHYTTYTLVKTEIPTKSSVGEKNCEEYVKRTVCRSVSSDTNVSLSSSAGSAATSGSQASCSSLESSIADTEKRKVTKTYNIDTINRKNILASAKCRSGRDAKLKSPVIESKFSHDSYDKPVSPTVKTSERLPTLTPLVSVMTNKGENRRRNKIITETDSDSDSEVNVRLRKTDYKNSRLKRSSSSVNKNKQNDPNVEIPKGEDGLRLISEKVITAEKVVIEPDSISSDVSATLPIKNNVNRTERTNIKKEEINIKTERTPNHKINNVNDNISTMRKEKSNRVLNNNNNIQASDKADNTIAEDTKIPTHVIKLKRGAGSGVGLILAGGVDCEAKDVTVHRVLADSVAAKAGLKRGAKIRSINGCSMAGLSHAESVTILKEQRSEVVIEIEDETRENVNGVGCDSEKAESKVRHEAVAVEAVDEDKICGSVVTVLLEKAGGGAGLGFGLDGGRDSPHGDRPLTIKKLFAGGAAAQSGRILVGAELLSAGGQSMEGFTRTQAWAALKALPAGSVALVLRNPKGAVNP